MGPRRNKYVGLALMLSALEGETRDLVDSIFDSDKTRKTYSTGPSAEKRKALRKKRKKRKRR